MNFRQNTPNICGQLTERESSQRPIRLRTKPMKRFRTIKSGVHLVFKLLERAKTGWRGIGPPEKLKEVKLPS